MSIDYKSNIDKIIDAWKRKPAVLEKALEDGLRDGLMVFEGQNIVKGMLSGRKSAYYGLNTLTGNARNSWTVSIDRRGIDTVGRISSAPRAWYLKVHQHFNFEGYIRPRNAQLLAIPVHPAARGKSPRDFDLVFIKPAGRPPLLIRQVRRGGAAREAGKERKIIREDIMFVLRPRVYVPKRLYLYEEFATHGRNIIRVNILERLKDAASKN
jgi:hypothetical protein